MSMNYFAKFGLLGLSSKSHIFILADRRTGRIDVDVVRSNQILLKHILFGLLDKVLYGVPLLIVGLTVFTQS